MPNIMVMKAVHIRNSHGVFLSGSSTWASIDGTPETPMMYWNTEATASR